MAGRKKISISDAVRRIAEDWKSEYLEGHSTATLQRLVHTILDDNISTLILTIIGIKKEYAGRVELIKSPDGKPSVVEILRERHQEQMIKRIQESPFFNDLTNFRLGENDRTFLKNEFKDAVLEKLQEKVRAKAEAFAEQIAIDTLSDLWVDEDVIRHVEAKLREDA